jgi:hypothetical protein
VNKIATLLALVIVVAACGGNTQTSSPVSPPRDRLEATRPAGLDIPAIAVHADEISTFAVDNEGDYRCPFDPQAAAWNRDGIVPGEPGLALIIAQGQGLFQRLGELKPDDPIYISRTDGSRLTFTASASTGASAQVQLTTCGGGTPADVYVGLVPQQ